MPDGLRLCTSPMTRSTRFSSVSLERCSSVSSDLSTSAGAACFSPFFSPDLASDLVPALSSSSASHERCFARVGCSLSLYALDPGTKRISSLISSFGAPKTSQSSSSSASRTGCDARNVPPPSKLSKSFSVQDVSPPRWTIGGADPKISSLCAASFVSRLVNVGCSGLAPSRAHACFSASLTACMSTRRSLSFDVLLASARVPSVPTSTPGYSGPALGAAAPQSAPKSSASSASRDNARALRPVPVWRPFDASAAPLPPSRARSVPRA
eukprot:6185244-Pleurochrysis_carterae.AAC.7